jgi:glycosyltransferase involved in cell wall biosynthesis
LHWINEGMLPPWELAALPGPLVWTWHDAWGATGGCHYSGGCQRWQNACGRCPALSSGIKKDLSSLVMAAKRHFWKNLELTLVCPSRWLAGVAAASPLAPRKKIRVIPYALDTRVWKPGSRAAARKALGIHPRETVLAFGAANADSDPRKGGDLLARALGRVAAKRKNLRLLILGGSGGPGLPAGLRITPVQGLSDPAALIPWLWAADTLVAPSREDNLPLMAMEAAACGLPVAAFNIGGMPDLVAHKKTGALAGAFDTGDLARAITWCLDNKPRAGQLARRRATSLWSEKIVAGAHQELYREVLGERRNLSGSW